MNDTGKFFGEVEGAVMEVMVKEQIFDRITVYDYQGLCKNVTRGNETKSDENSARGLITVCIIVLYNLLSFSYLVEKNRK